MSLIVADQPMLVVLACDTEATDWHVIRGFDPDQQSLAEEAAEDYLTRLPDGSQVAVARVYAYGIVDRRR